MLETLLKQIKEGSGENKKLSLLPNDVVTALKKRVREGAEDQEQGWANALELVHKAYEVEGVVRPDPSMADAWKQYEEMLQYAVQQLAKNRGMDGDWRMSSSMFREAYTKKQKFLVTIGKDEFVTEGNDITVSLAFDVEGLSAVALMLDIIGRHRLDLETGNGFNVAVFHDDAAIGFISAQLRCDDDGFLRLNLR